MFENTNPEFQGNPESGIDQLLNRTEPTVEAIVAESDKARIAELEARVVELQKELALVADQRTENWELWNNLVIKVGKAEEAFKEILEGDMDAKDIMETYGAVLAEHLGWSFTRQATLEITVTWKGTVELPFGVEVEDLDINDFGIDEPCHYEYSSYFGHCGITDYSIEER